MWLTACGPASPIFVVVSDSGTTGEEASETSGSTAPAQGEPVSSSDGSTGTGDGTSETSVTFLLEPDGGGVSYECDLWAQDCPPGHKCNVWADDGGSSWNATACFPIPPEPDGPGEPCTVEGSGTSGIDTCERGALCWNVDPKTNEGTCVEYCQGDAAHPFCEDPGMFCGGSRDIPLCVPLCCPVEQDCPEGQACYAVNDEFYCAPDASGDLGAFGDACEFINVCDPGLMCLNASVVPPGMPCEGAAGCCTPFCVVGSSACSELHPAMDCFPWFEDGHAPPGFELTGVCTLPA